VLNVNRKHSSGELTIFLIQQPFATFEHNPSWLAIKDLHDIYLSIKHRPQPSPSSSDKEKKKNDDDDDKGPRIHIQAIQSSVSYSHVLSLVPLIHGVNPSAPEARVHFDPKGDQPDPETHEGPQGNGSPFPEGYPVQLPAKGKFDLVVHIGVGSKGALVLEKLGHKRGYQIADVEHKKAPVATDQKPDKDLERSEDEQRELARMAPRDASDTRKPRDMVRGFGIGYEDFKDEESTSNDVNGLVEWLQTECNFKHTRASHDAGRYLCDFIVSTTDQVTMKIHMADTFPCQYYCSLCESKRRGAGTKVQFIHVPPTGEPQSSEDCKETIANAIWWLLVHNGHNT
jgi:pyroglutamyl-peptidase